MPALRKTRTHSASDTESWRGCSGDRDVDDGKATATTTTTMTRDIQMATAIVAIWMDVVEHDPMS